MRRNSAQDRIFSKRLRISGSFLSTSGASSRLPFRVLPSSAAAGEPLLRQRVLVVPAAARRQRQDVAPDGHGQMPAVALRRPPVRRDLLVAADCGEHPLGEGQPCLRPAEKLDDAGLHRRLHLRQRPPGPDRQHAAAEVAVDRGEAAVLGERPLAGAHRPLQPKEIRRQRVPGRSPSARCRGRRPSGEPEIEVAIRPGVRAGVDHRRQEQRVAVDPRAQERLRFGAEALAQAPAVARDGHARRADGNAAVAAKRPEEQTQRLQHLLQADRGVREARAGGGVADETVPSAADRLLGLQQLLPQRHAAQPRIARTTSCSPALTSALSLSGSTSAASTASAGAMPAAIRLAQ